MVGLVERRTVEGHDRVPDVLVHGAAVLEDDLGHGRQVIAEHLDHLFGRELLRERGETSDVGEEHRDPAAASNERTLALTPQDLLDDVGGEEPRQAPLLALLADVVDHHGRAVAGEQSQLDREPIHPEVEADEGPEADHRIRGAYRHDQEEGADRAQFEGGESRQKGGDQGQEGSEVQVDPGQPIPLEEVLQQVGVDFDSGHSVQPREQPRGERGEKVVVKGKRRCPHHDDLALKDFRLHLAVQHPVVRDDGERPPGASIVDVHRRFLGERLGGNPRLDRQVVEMDIEALLDAALVGKPEIARPDEAVLVRREVDKAEGRGPFPDHGEGGVEVVLDAILPLGLR